MKGHLPRQKDSFCGNLFKENKLLTLSKGDHGILSRLLEPERGIPLIINAFRVEFHTFRDLCVSLRLFWLTWLTKPEDDIWIRRFKIYVKWDIHQFVNGEDFTGKSPLPFMWLVRSSFGKKIATQKDSFLPWIRLIYGSTNYLCPLVRRPLRASDVMPFLKSILTSFAILSHSTTCIYGG